MTATSGSPVVAALLGGGRSGDDAAPTLAPRVPGLMRRSIILAVVLLPAAGFHRDGMPTVRPPSRIPDSTLVAFETHEGTRLAADVSRRDGSVAFDLLGQLWIIPPNGGEARAVTDAVRDTAEDLDPSFSPDGRRLLFQSDRPGGRALWLLDLAGGPPARVTTARIPYYARAEPAWSPDGRQFVYIRGGAVVVHDVAAGSDRVVRVTGLPNVAASSPSWSSDGRALVFVNGGKRVGVWRVSVGGGEVERIGDSTVAPIVAAISRSDTLLALIAPDSIGRAQIWVQRIGAPARRLTAHQDVAKHRVRWADDERSLIYSADGRLWRVDVGGGAPVEIPFTARIRFTRRTTSAREVRFPAPGSRQRARGFDGLALSPDASRIAMLALDSLWVWKPGESPRAIVATDRSAHDLTWSPDARTVAWSAGPPGEEDLVAADIDSRATWPLTTMRGGELRPSWSPDGRFVAFLHAATAPPGAVFRLRVAAVKNRATITDAEAPNAVRDFGPIDGLWMGEQAYVWTPDSRAIMTYANPILGDEPYPARVRLVPLDSAPRQLTTKLHAPSFLSVNDGVATYVEGNRLWRGRLRVSGQQPDAPRPIGDDPALAASTARDGTVLYLSEDGLRLRRPDGRVERLGWPLTFHIAEPPPVLLRNVHVIDGRGNAASPLRDVLLRAGHIARIGETGSIRAPNAASVIDADGRYLMPGLIDMHAHFFPESPPDGFLYHGVTTARDVGSSATHTAALRDAVDAGVASGPRIVVGGFFFHTSGGDANGPTGVTEQNVGDSAGLDRAMRLARGLGVGFIKHRAFDDWAAGARTIAAAHRYGFPISGHCVHILPLVAAGMDGKEHSGDCFRDFGHIYSDFTRLYAAAGLWLDPTVGLFVPIARAAADSTTLDDGGIAPWLVPSLRRRYLSGQPAASLERSVGLAVARTAKLHAANVPIVAGTDQGLADGIHWELATLVRAGLSPFEAIAAATSRAARVLGAGQEIGTVEVGKLADLVILDRSPLDDIANTRRIWRVIQGGRIVDRDALLRRAPNAGTLGATASRTKAQSP